VSRVGHGATDVRPYGEALGPLQALGGALVLAAVVALQTRGARALAGARGPLVQEAG